MVVLPLHDDNPLRRIRRQWAVYGLIVLNVAVFLLERHFQAQESWPSVFGLIPAHVLDDPTDLLTSMFLHADVMHLAGNMLFLWVFGDNVEDALGHSRFVVFYLLCGLLAAAGEIARDPASAVPMIGASGAVSGLMGAYVLLYPQARVLTIMFRFAWKLPAWGVLGVWIGWQVVQFVKADPDVHVAWVAHIAGFAAGLVLIIPFRRPGVKLLRPADPA